MRRLGNGVLVALLCLQFSCAKIRNPFELHEPYTWRKPIGKGALIPAAICGLAGAGVGAYIQSLRPGHTVFDCQGDPRCPSDGYVRLEDDPEYWKGALIGGAAGTLICGAIGHLFFDEIPPVPTPTPGPIGAGEAPGGVAVGAKKRIVLRGVYFDFDRSDIRPDSAPVLDEAASLIATTAEVEMVVVEGHTDAEGTVEYNQALSIRRAESVYRYLINKGVPPERLQTEGYGELRPVADNTTETGRAQNRRVELRVQTKPSRPPQPVPGPEDEPLATPTPEAD